MPTLEQNKRLWDGLYDWNTKGDEWSAGWGGTDMEWYGTILPRIHAFVPTTTILEIGPGFGRWSQFLKALCKQLFLVDISETCIQACRERFAPWTHISYFFNDGQSLDMIDDDSIDFVFSFDSLVHAEDKVIENYIRQLSKKLKHDGAGFIHHSNMGEYAGYFSLLNSLPKGRGFLVKCGLADHHHDRAINMSAEKFRRYAEESGLHCLSQEAVNWGTKRLIDCFSVLSRAKPPEGYPNRLLRNNRFMEEAQQISKLAALYNIPPSNPAGG